METKAIELSNVYKHYKKVRALNGVSFAVDQGKIYALLGPNGAGKTTIVKILTTLLRADQGEARVLGFDVRSHPHEVRKVIGLTGQYAALDDNLTGKENLEMVGRLYHLKEQEISDRVRELLDKFGLTDAAGRVVKTYSGGMRRRLDVALSLISKPQVLFLDEPTTGLDLTSRIELWKIIHKLVEEGTTVLLTTQYLEEADQLADEIMVIDQGQMIAQGAPETLKRQIGNEVVEIYLGSLDAAEKASQTIGQQLDLDNEIDRQQLVVSVNIKNGTHSLLAIIRLLDAQAVEIRDILVRKPTLDDVFLKLTGHRV